AIISGAYFGDKMSPLSDTTVMSSYVVGVPLFEHIKYLMITTIPAIIIALVLYTIIGITHSGASPEEIRLYTTSIKDTFNLSPFLLIVPIITGLMIYKKRPALVVLGISSLLACISAVILQPEIIKTLGEKVTGIRTGAGTVFTGAIRIIYDSTEIDTGVSEVTSLISSRGMLGMLNTVFLIICAMAFGASMKAGGMISRIASILLPLTKTRGGLVASTVATGFCLNGIASDQFLSIIITSDIYKDIYKKEGYEPRLLSRSVEDSATVTSPLIPWSTCGMTQATILGIPTFIYAPFSFFNWLSPLMSILVATIGYKIVRKKPEEVPVA
ncbi:MAG: sodium:proton antiporter, partial [Bacteroidales bacterium]|nr:sodium:proton antiporter [Bacteroidales bacterium]